jgi:hypothetical protein
MLVSPGTPSQVKHSQGLSKQHNIIPDKSIVRKLINWSEETVSRDFSKSHLTPSALLPITHIKLIATLSPLNAKQLEQYLRPQWYFWGKYRPELVSRLLEPEPGGHNLTSTASNSILCFGSSFRSCIDGTPLRNRSSIATIDVPGLLGDTSNTAADSEVPSTPARTQRKRVSAPLTRSPASQSCRKRSRIRPQAPVTEANVPTTPHQNPAIHPPFIPSTPYAIRQYYNQTPNPLLSQPLYFSSHTPILVPQPAYPTMPCNPQAPAVTASIPQREGRVLQNTSLTAYPSNTPFPVFPYNSTPTPFIPMHYVQHPFSQPSNTNIHVRSAQQHIFAAPGTTSYHNFQDNIPSSQIFRHWYC